MKFSMIEADEVGLQVTHDADNLYRVTARSKVVFIDRDIERVRAFLIGVALGRVMEQAA
jgi:hypothetical protein